MYATGGNDNDLLSVTGESKSILSDLVILSLSHFSHISTVNHKASYCVIQVWRNSQSLTKRVVVCVIIDHILQKHKNILSLSIYYIPDRITS